jgi:hypothetical protein
MVLMEVAESARRSDITSGGGSVDRLGRSLQDLVGFLNHLQETRLNCSSISKG